MVTLFEVKTGYISRVLWGEFVACAGRGHHGESDSFTLCGWGFLLASRLTYCGQDGLIKLCRSHRK